MVPSEVIDVLLILYAVFTTGYGESKWSEWTHWSECSVTCGYGQKTRQRVWLKEDGTKGSTYTDNGQCTMTYCPIDGMWSYWASWSRCSHLCNGGTLHRERKCSSPEPQYNGKKCEGEAFESGECNNTPCPVLPKNFNMSSCKLGYFICASQHMCIPGDQKCDDTVQCHDLSDEKDCVQYATSIGRNPNGAPRAGGVLYPFLIMLSFLVHTFDSR